MPGSNTEIRPVASFGHNYFTHESGLKIHYVDEGPKDAEFVFVLVHGFPDVWLTYRKLLKELQPQLESTKRSFRYILPSLLGFGQSDHPYAEMENQSILQKYSLKSQCSYLKGLVDHAIKDRKKTTLVWLGHDWGSPVVFRMKLYYPDYVDGIIALCVPFTPPSPQFIEIRDIVKRFPTFQYQIWFAESNEADKIYDANVELVIRGLYQSWKNPPAVMTGEDVEKLKTLPETDKVKAAIKENFLLSSEELEYYNSCYSKTGFGPALNLYRVRKINFDDEMEFTKVAPNTLINVPVLQITVGYDPAFPAALAERSKAVLLHAEFKHIQEASHWVQLEQPKAVADFIASWFQNFSLNLPTRL